MTILLELLPPPSLLFHMMSHSSCPSPTDLDPQALSEVHLKWEMRAQFTKLGLDQDFEEDVIPPVSRAPLALPMFSLQGLPVASVPTPEFSITTGVFKEPTPTPADHLLASGAQQPVDPCNIPLGAKQVGKRSLSGNVDLSVFDILNTFCCHWFLSMDHLRAQALLAQKGEDGNFFG
jgi:hypothetical protein